MLGAEFELREPPQLVRRMRALGQRVQRDENETARLQAGCPRRGDERGERVGAAVHQRLPVG